jgi:predicted CXXCH cytochrome family protein
MTFAYSDACQKCHSTQFEDTHDSIHQQMIEAGNLNAPVCADCHGAHNIQFPDEPRATISNTCGTCHTEINAAYRESIHGKALIDEDNQDVPVCTDCHGVHNIQDPRTDAFRVQEPDLCAGCHANPELMGKYGISPDVYGLYNLSWHGVDVSVYKARWPNVWHESAVCSDCHGVHDIHPTDDPSSKVNVQNRLATCQQCHPGVGPNWLSAWVGHNRIDPQQTPALYYTEVFYGGLAPAVLWVSLGYVLLQALHALIERIRRSLP